MAKAAPASQFNGVAIPAVNIPAAWVNDAIYTAVGGAAYDLAMADAIMANAGMPRRARDDRLMQPAIVQWGADDFAQAIADELPTGSAWPRDPDNDVMKWVSGNALIWGDVSARAAALLVVEADPAIHARAPPGLGARLRPAGSVRQAHSDDPGAAAGARQQAHDAGRPEPGLLSRA